MSNKVAAVTGGNKGIGYAIVKGLCEGFQGVVYLTARDVERGEKAVEALKQLGYAPKFHQLDITDKKSIEKFRDYIKEQHGGLDLLVNNAAIAFKHAATEPFSQQAEETVAVNYYGTLNVCEILFPILKPNARVVNISSSCGHLSKIPSDELKAKLKNPSLTIDELNKLMDDFVQCAKENKAADWGKSCYIVSKVGVSALTFIQQRNFESEEPNRNISVNCVHPGYVDTDMTSHKGPLTIEEGAKAPLFLSLGNHNLKGAYVWSNSEVVDWTAADTPSIY